MDVAEVRAQFDQQMRRRPTTEPGSLVEADARVTRILGRDDGWSGVIWSDLDDDVADETIAAQVARLSAWARPWEWKYYSHDRPADLPERIRAAGLRADPVESVLVAEVARVALDPVVPPGIDLVPVADQAGVDALVQVHDEVFGGSHAGIGRAILEGLHSEPPPVVAVVAVADGSPISAGRVEFPGGRDFASIWGGGTLPDWRGRGVFRALVAYRAALARDRGYRYLHVDASAQSRPTLLRFGFVELAKTIPFRAV